MKLVSKTASILTLVCLPFVATDAQAVTIATATGGPSLMSGALYVGQSFTVTGAGSFTNVSFNFFSDLASTAPYATGTAFLFSTLYTGTAGTLSSASPGYLGQASAAGGFYNFGSSVTLPAGSEFFLYSNTLFPEGSISGNNAYAGGLAYFSPAAGSTFFASSSANFRVTGDPANASVPDGGSTVLMFALGFIAVCFGRGPRRE